MKIAKELAKVITDSSKRVHAGEGWQRSRGPLALLHQGRMETLQFSTPRRGERMTAKEALGIYYQLCEAHRYISVLDTHRAEEILDAGHRASSMSGSTQLLRELTSEAPRKKYLTPDIVHPQ